MRGEKFLIISHTTLGMGSPPLAWGKGAKKHTGVQLDGITPTCVGKSRTRYHSRRRCGDHPHLRGEKAGPGVVGVPGKGSPPLAWGKGWCNLAETRSTGITPTCVGKSIICVRRCYHGWDHPHLRGEKSARQEFAATDTGSPPLAWGKGQVGRVLALGGGITPTCVGKRSRELGLVQAAEDHPHLRGEKWAWVPHGDTCPGSPPLAWGKVGS